jgi:hypothetical protein
MPEENATNILPFRRDRLRDHPFCAQCRAPMTIDRCEPDFETSISLVATYRCANCGLLERRRIQYYSALVAKRTSRPGTMGLRAEAGRRVRHISPWPTQPQGGRSGEAPGRPLSFKALVVV